MIKEVAWRGKGSGGGGSKGFGSGGQGWVGTHRSWPGGRGVREAGQGLGGGCKGFGSGGVGGRDTGVQGRSKFRNVCRIFVVSNVQKEEKWLFLKDALWGGGGGTHRSWPGGRGG